MTKTHEMSYYSVLNLCLNMFLKINFVLFLNFLLIYSNESDLGYDFREVSKILSDNCLQNISENVILCTKTFESRVMALNSRGNYDGKNVS